MVEKNTYALDFIEPNACVEIIKQHYPNCKHEEKNWAHHFILNSKNKIIVYFDNSGHLTLDLNQCREMRDNFCSKMENILFLSDNEKGKYKLPHTWKLYSRKLSFDLKNALSKKFGNKIKDTGNSPEQYFVLAIKGKNSIVHMKNSELTLQGPNPNKITDEIYVFVDNFLKENTENNKRRFKEIEVTKDAFENFLQNNIGIELVKNIKKEVYEFLSGRDVWEIDDGFHVYDAVKTGNIKLKNYKILVRSFSIAFEGFLIKYFLEVGFINKEEYEQDPTTANIFKCINKLRQQYGTIIERKQKGLIGKVSSLWNECRNNYLHSDMYSYSHLLTIQQAESKIIEILTTMDQLLDVLPLIKGEEE